MIQLKQEALSVLLMTSTLVFPERFSDLSRVVWQDGIKSQLGSQSGWLQVQCSFHHSLLLYPAGWDWKKGGNKLSKIF